MKNGPYELVVAPENYPGKKYRGRYCYEHHLVWWQHTGEVILEDEWLLHHRDENKRNNAIENLEKLSSRSAHMHVHKGVAQHATESKYQAGCRCEDCKQAHRTYSREYARQCRQRKKDESLCTWGGAALSMR